VSLLDLIREFVALSGESAWGGDSLPRVKELMIELRRRGFTSLEISELSGGRWADSVVRGYTRDWGGVVDLSEKKRIMSELRKLVSSKHTVEDVELFTEVEKSIKLKQSTPEKVAELNSNMGDLGLAPGEVGEMLAVSRSVREEPGGVVGVRNRIALDKELRDQGVTHKVMLSLQEECKRYEGLGGVLEGMHLYLSVQDLKKAYDEVNTNLSTRMNELGDVGTRLEKDKETVANLSLIYNYGWNPDTLMAFPSWLRKSDTRESIRQALKGTRSIQDLQARISDLRKRNAALNLENTHIIHENLRALDNLEQLAKDLDLGQDLDKRREELKRRLRLKLSGEDTLTFFDLLYDYKDIDPKSYEVNRTLLMAISNFIIAVETDKEASAQRQAAIFLGQAKAELESIVLLWEKMMKFTEDGSKQQGT
jgi:hypothetical protein